MTAIIWYSYAEVSIRLPQKSQGVTQRFLVVDKRLKILLPKVKNCFGRYERRGFSSSTGRGDRQCIFSLKANKVKIGRAHV